MIQSFDEPLVVVSLDEGADDRPGLIERVEAVQPQTLFLERAHEALDDSVALRLADEGRAVGDPGPGQLPAKRVGHILQAPGAPPRRARRETLAARAAGGPQHLG